jgi:hypothetical protein
MQYPDLKRQGHGHLFERLKKWLLKLLCIMKQYVAQNDSGAVCSHIYRKVKNGLFFPPKDTCTQYFMAIVAV